MADKSSTSDQQSTETGEQSDKDQAGSKDSGVDEGAEETQTEEEAEEEGDEDEGGDEDSDEDEAGEQNVISDEDFAKLKDNPDALRKALNKAVTKKFQSLARDRKELRPYRNLIDSLNSSPKETVAALAKQFGLDIAAPKGSTEEVVETVSDKVTQAVAKALGENYADLAPALSTAIREAAELIVADRIKNTNEQLDEVKAESAMQEANAAIAVFAEKHPDWKKHEKAMVTLSNRIKPAEGMDQIEYMEILYREVTRDGARGDGIKRAVKRMTQSVKESEKPTTTVEAKAVVLAPGKIPTFKEAAAAARRGERFE